MQVVVFNTVFICRNKYWSTTPASLIQLLRVYQEGIKLIGIDGISI
jgi:hypothetical protein